MQYPVLPESEGGSHLFVTLAGGSATLHLVHANYKDATSEIETLVIPVPDDISVDELDRMLEDGLPEWAEETGWDLLDCEDGVCMLSLCEGDCVHGSSLITAEPFETSSFNSLVLETQSESYDSQAYIDAAAHYFKKFSLTNLVYVVLNWDSIRVLSVRYRGKVTGDREGIVVREMELDAAFLNDIAQSSLSSLLSVSMRRDNAIDLLSNIRERGIYGSISPEVHDIVRAFITSALFGVKDTSLQSFGIDTPEGAVLITGDIVRSVPKAYSVLSVVDGLQLRGRYLIAVDDDMRSVPGSYAAKSKRFLFPMHSVFPTWYQYISTEKGGSGRKGETAFRGFVRESSSGEEVNDELLIGRTGTISAVPVEGAGAVFLEPAKRVFFPNMIQKRLGGRKYMATEFGGAISSVIVDCRSIPVVYGPDAASNHERVKGWIRGLPG